MIDYTCVFLYDGAMINHAAKIDVLFDQVQNLLAYTSENGKNLATPLPGLTVLRETHTTALEATLYEPTACLILQGSKETIIGDTVLRFGAGQSLIISHDLPVVSRITEASAARPYIALVFALDLGILRDLYARVGETELETEQVSSAAVNYTDEALIDAFSRYVALTEAPLEANILGPLIRTEIHFRLLVAPHGGMLRRLLLHGSHESSISRVITQIRQAYKRPLLVPELAKMAGMSASAFHKHFKTITATTPLQYQKNLRLMEARRLLLAEGYSVTTAAFEVGYESVTQFSREYARKFGASPRHDLQVA